MKKITIIALLLSIAGTLAEAKDFNSRNILIGSRAAMLGGAYTALSDDLSGCYYNPGGIAFINDFVISADGKIITYNYYKRKGKLYDNGVIYGYNLSYLDSSGIPNMISFGSRLGRHLAASFSLITIDSEKYADSHVDGILHQMVASPYLRTRDYENKGMLVGPSLAWKISDSVGVGISLFYHSVNYTNAAINVFTNSQFTFFNTDTSYFGGGGIVAAAGVKWNISDVWKAGLTYFSQTFHLNGKEKHTYFDFIYSQVMPMTTEFYYYEQRSGYYRLPQKIAAGLAYEATREIVLAVDAIFYFPLSYVKNYREYPGNSLKEVFHYDLSLGCEYFFTKRYSLRAGFFTNTSSSPHRVNEINRYGGTLGIGVYADKGFSSGLGCTFSYGRTRGYSINYSAMSIENDRTEKLSAGFLLGAIKEF